MCNHSIVVRCSGMVSSVPSKRTPMLFQSVQPTMWMLLITVCMAHLDLMQTHHPCKQMFCPLQNTHATGDIVL